MDAVAVEWGQLDGLGMERHVPALAAAMAGDGDGPRTRFVDGTLCFADISGFTALTERLVRHGRVGAEALVETLSDVFGAMLDIAEARGGMLLKFGGDALLFLFQGDGHATRAASAAVEIPAQHARQESNAERHRPARADHVRRPPLRRVPLLPRRLEPS